MSKAEKSLARADFHAEARKVADACPRCLEARAKVAAQGYTVSSVPDHGEDFCAAQSVEHCGPTTFTHPRAYAQVRALHPRDVQELSLGTVTK